MAKRKPNFYRIEGIESRVFQGDLPKQSYGRFRHAKQIAVDLEYKTIEQNKFDFDTIKLASVQVSSPGLGAIIIRVQNGERPLYLIEVLKNPDIQKIFHFAFGDCSLITKNWGIRVENVACTKIAAKVLFSDNNSKTSLIDLLPKYLNISVSKTEQLSDWLIQSLTIEQITYATRDVLYLIPLYEKLVEELTIKGKMHEVQKIWDSLPDIVADEVSGEHKKVGWHDALIEYK